MDGAPIQRPGLDLMDASHHFAKVRVAVSNSVFPPEKVMVETFPKFGDEQTPGTLRMRSRDGAPPPSTASLSWRRARVLDRGHREHQESLDPPGHLMSLAFRCSGRQQRISAKSRDLGGPVQGWQRCARSEAK